MTLKPSVQAEAMKAVGRLYNLAYPEMCVYVLYSTYSALSDVRCKARTTILPLLSTSHGYPSRFFTWLLRPRRSSTLFSALISSSSSDPHIDSLRALAEQVLAEYILPLPAASSSTGKTSEVDEVSWTDRMLTTMKYLDSTAVNTLLGLSGIKLPCVLVYARTRTVFIESSLRRPTLYEHYVESCIANNVRSSAQKRESCSPTFRVASSTRMRKKSRRSWTRTLNVSLVHIFVLPS